MIQKLIANKIKNITKDNLKQLANEHHISLNDKEINYLYYKLHHDWYDFIYNDPTPILNDIKANINKDSFDQLLIIYNQYKDKYQGYL
ncbi:MAG: hypothetical protein V8Q75_04560 [Bacilli bacterium]